MGVCSCVVVLKLVVSSVRRRVDDVAKDIQDLRRNWGGGGV